MRKCISLFRRLHADDRGVTSLMSLVAVLVFTMLLVMLTNIVRHLDDKVRMQNAADAAAYSGAATLARGMNCLAFANHLQAETLAHVALLRALEERGSSSARLLLPMLQSVLGTPEAETLASGDRLISNYQRDVIAVFPMLADETTLEISLRHGLPRGELPPSATQARSLPSSAFGSRGPQPGVLWLERGAAVRENDERDPATRTLPVIDPNADGADAARLTDLGDRQAIAAVRRLETATEALRQLHSQLPATRQQDATLLADATRFLNHLLEVEFPTTNLPIILRSMTGATDGESLTDDHSVLATVHRAFDREHGPRLFRNPLAARSDAMTFAQAEFFLPRARYRCCPWTLETPAGAVSQRDPWPDQWDSLNQTWSARLIPTNETAAAIILQTPPPGSASGLRPLRLDGVTPVDIERVNTH
jgi:hypothetical protein